MDGNVLRVIARLTDDHGDAAAPQTKKNIRAQVQEIFPEAEADIRDFNQALMELGATVCVPNGPPRCLLCPVRDLCLGRERGTAESLPVKQPKKARRVEEKTVFLLLREGKTALRKRPGSGLLAGLWEFPSVEGRLEEAAAGEAVRAWGLEPVEWKNRLAAKHIFSHVEWHMTGYTLAVSGGGFHLGGYPGAPRRSLGLLPLYGGGPAGAGKIRTCIHNRGTRYGGKRTSRTAFSGCEYRL